MEGEAVMVKLALIDANDFVQSVLLDDEPYKLHFAWNDTSKAWTLDLRDSHGKDIVRGIRIVPNFPLLHQMKRNGLPKGEFMAVVVNFKQHDCQMIGRRDFLNGRASLVYISEVEKDAMLEAAISR